MPDLVLTTREQIALRTLYACSPVPGCPMPTPDVFDLVSRLIPGDALGACLADDRGHLIEMANVPRHYYDDFLDADPDAGEPGALRLGITHWSRNLEAAQACDALPGGIADGVVVGFRNGINSVSQLYIDRRKRMFGERDLAMLQLIAPALQRILRERPTPAMPASITVQERRVLMQVAAGLSNAEIAAALFVAPSTVRKHLENSFRKLGVRSRIAAVAAIQGADLPDQDLRERIERLA